MNKCYKSRLAGIPLEDPRAGRPRGSRQTSGCSHNWDGSMSITLKPPLPDPILVKSPEVV